MSAWIGIETADGSFMHGMRVVVSPMLPIEPSPGEDGRRIVRHGMADILEWLGEPVGPKPGQAQHSIYAFDGSRDAPAGAVLFVSRETADKLGALTDNQFSIRQEPNS